MSQYLSHLAALTLNQVEPVQPRLASRFETPVNRGSSDHNGLDETQDFRAPVPPVREQSMKVTAADSPDRVEPAPPHGVNSRFEIPIDKEASEHNGLNLIEKSRLSAQPAPVQPSPVTATESPVAQRILTKSADDQTKKKSSGQDQPKVLEPTEFMIKKSELPGDARKLSSGQSFALFDTKVDTEKANRAAQSVSKPDVQAPYEAHKDALPTENVRTLVERVQERFTETTYNEFVIREVVAPDANKKSSKLEESPRAAPVRPASITVLSEQSSAGPNTASQADAQSRPFAQSGTDTTPAQTIQVTIGRIEIRAQQQTPPSNKVQRSTPAVMSLADYLNSRRGA